MALTEVEHLFIEYRRTGDAAALAQVFDRIAPELLLVAGHLGQHRRTAPGSEPEDLVQSTFLAAIESAARYDGVRPLRQWLIGILVNIARHERRRSGHEIHAARLPAHEAPDPL